MNLFVVGHALRPDVSAKLFPALRYVADRQASIAAAQSFEWRSPDKATAVACTYDAQESLGERQYVAETDDAIVLYDGLPVDSAGGIAFHRADNLYPNWDSHVADLDGFFCAVRILKSSLRLDVQMDSFGAYGVYYWTDGKAWLISNSVAVLELLDPVADLDREGAARFLTIGWVAGNRTLSSSARAFPAGERWTWKDKHSAPTRQSSFDRKSLAQLPKSRVSKVDIDSLYEDSTRALSTIGEHFAHVHCPLTAGRDSRVLAALLSAAGVDARYYTYGNSEGVDSQVAAEVAQVIGAKHETILTETRSLLENWSVAVMSFVAAGDGMCPLQLILGNVSAQMVSDSPKPVRIWGAGGEIARAFHFNPIQTVRGTTVARVQQTIAQRWTSDVNKLVLPDVRKSARNFLDRTIQELADDGFHPDDLGDVFYLYERGGRRAGKNMRANMALRDSFSPFFSRSFVRAAFSLDECSRRTEPLHFELLKRAAPKLIDVRFDKGRWTSRSPTVNLYRELYEKLSTRVLHRVARDLPMFQTIEKNHILVKDNNFDRVAWLRHFSHDLRRQCLDDPHSFIWDFIDRPRFETATRDDDNGEGLIRNAKGLFLVATLFYYRSIDQTVPENRWAS